MKPNPSELKYDVVVTNVKFCDDCKWSKGKKSDICKRPVPVVKDYRRSPVMDDFHLKDYTRKDKMKCGPEAAWFEEKFRLFRWIARKIHGDSAR